MQQSPKYSQKEAEFKQKSLEDATGLDLGVKPVKFWPI